MWYLEWKTDEHISSYLYDNEYTYILFDTYDILVC